MWRRKSCKPSDPYERARAEMVDRQIAARGINDARLLDAMRRVPRHAFVPDESVERAYEDHAMPIGQGQTISQPYMVAVMTQLLEVGPADRVLEIGTGSGYQSAILSLLAREVITVERVPFLAESARRRLLSLGYENVTVIVGDGTLGYPEKAPYNAIIVTAGSPSVPEALKNQLAPNGRLVCPVGPRDLQHLAVIARTESGFRETTGIGCIFVPLIGEYGWKNSGHADAAAVF
ncbi:MAG TPA: protein-L-isoaspartate(D-aspartate) O-methyltransferase [Candidatus Hydrogenedentes bacterium]|mgnify:FL=1|nr:protein-L-isoaspartate(D-aspartate) O-methyltransferase [Candidatus Hydrogenedentota bacterium]HPC17805.1 protein-L-isoaspartate(D-aspartate) O-methyltransferase [Candidatus Hydrogenedentota bacterium]HRT20680.1 protein-L-isoaspartate(D-aspartate) O-methyltransferase [Candidatus Hydrogenedentota bacterium]HRT65716.1 protein-L-isoaspartate(D-aspartate) O-methyltransferase [Candidatus Hydrogenedentota bacterium]